MHFLQGIQTPVTDLEVSGEASDAQLDIVDMLVGDSSIITRQNSKHGEDHTHDHNVQNAFDI